MLTKVGIGMKHGEAFKSYSGVVHYLVDLAPEKYAAFCGAGKNSTGERLSSIWLVTGKEVNCKKCLRMVNGD